MITENFFGNIVNVGSLLEEKRPCMDIFIKQGEDGYKEMENFHILTKDKNCLFDVGCALGMFSLVFCNTDKKVSHAFDASHETQLIVEQSILLNPNKNIIYHKMFFGDRDSITPYNSDGFHAFATNGSDRVLMICMDSFCALNDIIPDTIKIDTEGYEYNVLRGGSNLIMNYRPLMFIELHPNFCKMYGTNISQIFDLQKEFNYSIKDVNNIDVTLDQMGTIRSDSIRTVWYPN